MTKSTLYIVLHKRWYACVYMWMYVHVCIYMYVCTCICMCVYVCIYVCHILYFKTFFYDLCVLSISVIHPTLHFYVNLY